MKRFGFLSIGNTIHIKKTRRFYMMKRKGLILFSISMFVLITACGTNQSQEEMESQEPSLEVNHDVTEQENPNQTDDQEYMQSKMDELSFAEFELEVEYANNVEYEADIDERHDGTIKAEIDDEVNNEYLKGREAFDAIYPKLEQLDVSLDSAKQDVINQILQSFDLADDYTKFEIEITFNDGK